MCKDAELTFETLRMLTGCPHIILIFFSNSVISHILETSSSYSLLILPKIGTIWNLQRGSEAGNLGGKSATRELLSITPKKYTVVSWQSSFSSSFHHHDVLLNLCKCLMFFSTPLVRKRKNRGSIACTYAPAFLRFENLKENQRGKKSVTTRWAHSIF